MEFNKHVVACAVAVLGFVGLVQVNDANAQVSSAPQFKYLDLSNGQRVIVPVSDSRQALQGQQIWNSAIANTATGEVRVGQTGSLPNPAGGRVPVNAIGRLSSPGVAAAVGRVAVATAKTIGPIGVGLAVYDLAKELGFTLKRESTGEMTVSQDVVDGMGSCSAMAADYTSRNSADPRGITYTALQFSPPSSCFMDVKFRTQPSSNYQQWMSLQTAPTASNVPSTIQDFSTAVAAKTTWPAASKISDVVKADTNPELQVPDSIIATGPASSPGPTSSTVDTTNNTTTNTNTTYNHTYAGDKITTIVTTTNITTNNTSGAVTKNETTTATPPTTQPTPDKPVTCAPGSKELNCADLDTPVGEIPKVTKNISYQAETMFSARSCPADVTISQALTGRPIVLSYTPTCNALATYVKPIILAIALFMAYLIILPGSKQ